MAYPPMPCPVPAYPSWYAESRTRIPYPARQCPVLPWLMALCAVPYWYRLCCYAVYRTGMQLCVVGGEQTRSRSSFRLSPSRSTSLRPSYPMPGTDVAYGPTPCP
eukprot:228835-Rhodomonas_salina.1